MRAVVKESKIAKLRAYMGYDGQVGGQEGAILVFAHNKKEAKKIGYPVLSGWGCEFLDARFTWLKGNDQIFDEADKILLASNTPHVIESPEGCPKCERWGLVMMESGLCEGCDE